MLDGVDPLLERLARRDGDGFLGEDRAGVDALVDQMDCHPGLLDSGGERILDRMRARELRQQRGVDVDDLSGKRSRKGFVSRCM